MVRDGVAQQIGGIGPNDQTWFVATRRTGLRGVQSALCQWDVVALRRYDGVDAAVAELDATFADGIVVVIRAAVVGTE